MISRSYAKRRTTFVLLMLLTLSIVLNSCKEASHVINDSPVLIWQDEFEGPAGQKPDSTRWTFDIGTDWGNKQLEYDTDHPENVSLDGLGHLAITARQDSFAGQPYTSGRIKTEGLFEPTYGRFEARIKMPLGQGMWPAFWLLGSSIRSVGWPQCGEIDIMEYRGHEPATIHTTVHGPGYSGSKGRGRRTENPEQPYNEDFHIFAVDWRPESIIWFVDGEQVFHLEPSDIKGSWVFDHPFYIILNLAVGGGWVGSPNTETNFPQTLLVDYVRVYK